MWPRLAALCFEMTDLLRDPSSARGRIGEQKKYKYRKKNTISWKSETIIKDISKKSSYIWTNISMRDILIVHEDIFHQFSNQILNLKYSEFPEMGWF